MRNFFDFFLPTLPSAPILLVMQQSQPNIVFVYADDLGRGMLSAYGQKHFRTPNIDRVAREGMRFANSYGCAYCAPARASLFQGRHDCHAGQWTFTNGGIYTRYQSGELSMEEIMETVNTTSMTPTARTLFLGEALKEAGYTTGQIGKLDWGFASTPQRMKRQGWDYHYGYYDHIMCHGFYPSFLFENGERVDIEGNTHLFCGRGRSWDECPESHAIRWNREGKKHYSQDLFNDKIQDFLDTNRNRPFFLYHPSQLPHGPISVPEIHPGIRQAEGLTDYEKEYASMVLRLDDTVGLIYEKLESLKILDNTVIIFASDNGHEVYARQTGKTSKTTDIHTGVKFDDITTRFTSEAGGDVFNGNDGMSGLKFTSWEGGARIPFMIRWPGVVKENSSTTRLMANYDTMTTLSDIAGVKVPESRTDGVSFLPTLAGWEQEARKPVVFGSFLGPAIVTAEGWKLRSIAADQRFQLYRLQDDPREEHDLSAACPDITQDLTAQLFSMCDGNLTNGNPLSHNVDYQDERWNHLNPAVEKELSVLS